MMKRKTGVGIILLNSKKEVLLILRDNIHSIPYPDCWDLPGGHPEGEEAPEECIRREMTEELELELGEINFFKKYIWPDFDEYIFWKFIDLEPEKVKLHEGQKVRYFSFNDIKEMKLAFYYNQVFPEFYDYIKKDIYRENV